LSRELLDAIHFPACLSDASAARQTFLLTAASYSHLTSTVLYSLWALCVCLYSIFFPKRFLQSIAQPHQNTEMALERATTSKWHALHVIPVATMGNVQPEEGIKEGKGGKREKKRGGGHIYWGGTLHHSWLI